MNYNTCDFFAAGVPTTPAKLNRLLDACKLIDINPLKRILITPSAYPKSAGVVKELKQDNIIEEVIFDSGGFQVWNKTSKYTFDELLEINSKIYTENDWADYFILQDYPPSLQDSVKEANEKIDLTIKSTFALLDKLPDHVRKKCLPVIHAKYLDQIDYQIDIYQKHFDSMDIPITAFSNNVFGRSDIANGKRLTLDGLLLLEQIKKNGIATHFLGLGSPPLLYIFKDIDFNLKSYDNSSWIMCAGFGSILLPYRSSTPITGKVTDRVSIIRSQEDLDFHKEYTGHSCIFCEDFKELQEDPTKRAMHNIIVLSQLNSDYADNKRDISKLKKYAPKVHKLLSEYQTKNQTLTFL